MSEKNVFRSKEEELQRLTQEIAEIKAGIKEISAAVGRIERHVKRSFGIPPKPKRQSKSSADGEKNKQSKDEPSITPEEALSIFDDLSSSFNLENYQEIEKRLQGMIVPDLKLIAHELGVTFSARPSKKALCSGIIGRLNERAMLSKNINVTPSQAEQMKKNEST